ncbi:hypothetical protein D8I24_2329 (plasmid) [Cupriavidus necator H850]|nr:hypothetical protein D8I24_2329 [Cupriavidus necator H850]
MRSNQFDLCILLGLQGIFQVREDVMARNQNQQYRKKKNCNYC